jgi:hypothetical protein
VRSISGQVCIRKAPETLSTRGIFKCWGRSLIESENQFIIHTWGYVYMRPINLVSTGAGRISKDDLNFLMLVYAKNNLRRWHSRQTIIFISENLASITSKPVNRQWLENPGFIGKTLGGFTIDFLKQALQWKISMFGGDKQTQCNFQVYSP